MRYCFPTFPLKGALYCVLSFCNRIVTVSRPVLPSCLWLHLVGIVVVLLRAPPVRDVNSDFPMVLTPYHAMGSITEY